MAPNVIFVQLFFTCCVENFAIRSQLFIENNHLELGGFGILEALVIFTALNCNTFLVTLVLLPGMAILPYYLNMVAYAQLVQDPETNATCTEDEQR